MSFGEEELIYRFNSKSEFLFHTFSSLLLIVAPEFFKTLYKRAIVNRIVIKNTNIII